MQNRKILFISINIIFYFIWFMALFPSWRSPRCSWSSCWKVRCLSRALPTAISCSPSPTSCRFPSSSQPLWSSTVFLLPATLHSRVWAHRWFSSIIFALAELLSSLNFDLLLSLPHTFLSPHSTMTHVIILFSLLLQLPLSNLLPELQLYLIIIEYDLSTQQFRYFSFIFLSWVYSPMLQLHPLVVWTSNPIDVLFLSSHFFLYSIHHFILLECPTNFDAQFSNYRFLSIISIFLVYGILPFSVLSNSMLRFLCFCFLFVSPTFFSLRSIVSGWNFFVGFVDCEKCELRMLWMSDFHNSSHEVQFDPSSFVHPFHESLWTH